MSALDEAARALLLAPEGIGAYGAQRRLFIAARASQDARENYRSARRAVLSALENGALLHPGRRWCLGIDCWEVICRIPTPISTTNIVTLTEEGTW